AGNRPRHRNHRHGSGGGRPDHRDRLRRARERLPDRQHLSPIHQPPALGVAGGLQRSRPVGRVPGRQARLCGGRGRVSRIRRRRTARHPQCRVRHRVLERGTRPHGASPVRSRARGRHADARAPKTSRRLEQPRRALRPLRHRQLPAHEARRAARRRDPGRGLYRASRRQAGRSRPDAASGPKCRRARPCGRARRRSAPGHLTPERRGAQCASRLHRITGRARDLARIRFGLL
ncbi:MAG: DNA polymerase III epsilon subunit, partial [uncultured Microvirga sp.]